MRLIIPILAATLVLPAFIQAQEPEIRSAEPVKKTAVAKVVPVAKAAPPVKAPIYREGETAPGNRATFRPSDYLQLRIAGIPAEDQPAFQLEFTIGTDGYINVPYAGQVRRGLTQSELERAIARALIDAKIFTNPTPIINVPTQGRFITVGGSVRIPQRMPWSPDLTLLSALNAAGGAGDFGGDKVRLVRSQKVTVYSRKTLTKTPESDPSLLPGDQIELL